jgi:outer membrane biosynthesis protein TonB
VRSEAPAQTQQPAAPEPAAPVAKADEPQSKPTPQVAQEQASPPAPSTNVAAPSVARAQPESAAPPAPNSEPSKAPATPRSNSVPAHIASLPAQSAEDTDSEERGRLTAQDIGLSYPRKAKRLKLGGTLFVRLIVADDGGVLDVEIVEADPPSLKAVYEDSIEKAMMKLRYPPRKENWPAEYDLEVDPPAEN